MGRLFEVGSEREYWIRIVAILANINVEGANIGFDLVGTPCMACLQDQNISPKRHQ